jgi:pimeloyl-ACP methyl ester carboxylesterase
MIPGQPLSPDRDPPHAHPTLPPPPPSQVGRGPTLVLLHGFGSGLAAWAPALSGLAARHTVFTVDLPGHGRSARPAFPPGAAAGDSRCRSDEWGGATGLWLDGPRLGPAGEEAAAAAAGPELAEEYFVGPFEGWRAELCAQV